MDDSQGQLGIVCGRMLDEAGQGRVVQRLDDALTVEFGQAVDGVAGRGGRIDGRALHLAQGESF